MITKFISFLIVGLSGLLLDFGFTFICKEKVLLNKYLSNSIGFLISTISNYFLNRHFTFQSNNPDIVTEFYWYVGISIIALIIYNGIVWLGINKWKTNFYTAKLIGRVVFTFWNFFGHFFITFH
ncbi:MAG: GtrA family protein [Flavobacteriales bacterium]